MITNGCIKGLENLYLMLNSPSPTSSMRSWHASRSPFVVWRRYAASLRRNNTGRTEKTGTDQEERRRLKDWRGGTSIHWLQFAAVRDYETAD